MDKASWTIAPCPPGDLQALAHELGISRTLASVLVRRGLLEAFGKEG